MESLLIDALGQHPLLYKLYTQICCAFPIFDSSPSSEENVVRILEFGLERLTRSFPWVAGDVTYDEICEKYKIVPVGKIPLIVNDLRQDDSAPTMHGLREAKFPCRMLDESTIAPCLTINLPGATKGLGAFSAPVLAFQANFITGGLILTIVGQHNIMDMTGQDHVISLFSKACHGIPFTQEELLIGNMNREKVIPLLPDSYDIWNPGPELDFHVQRPTAVGSTFVSDGHAPNSTWGYVNFEQASLYQLKCWATETKDPSIPFVSTDDALCAFLWKCIARARLARLEPKLISTISRAVNLRSRMGVLSTYPGMLQSLTFARKSLQMLADGPLGIIASYLRSLLDPNVIDLVYQARAFSTFVARAGDQKTRASFTANMSPSSDLMISSWSKMQFYKYDFNLGLGTPEAVRRPSFPCFECLVYLMPRSPTGEVTVQICLRDEDWERLKEDEEFNLFAKYIG